MRRSEQAILTVNHLTKQFGGVIAVNDVSFEVRKGEIFAVIGPNGAGKTTLFNMITGILPPSEGTIQFNGMNITGKKPYQIAQLGITRTFQNLEVFTNMSVVENVMTGAHIKMKTGFLQAGFRFPSVWKEEMMIFKKAIHCLEKVGISHLAYESAEILPYGNQRLLEIARAMASDPTIILLDEPMAGLNDEESRKLVEIILQLREEGITFIFVEHDMETVMSISDQIVVLDNGVKIGEGTPEEIYRNEAVVAAYLGEEEESMC
jgi:branched-chain amino acid transport system ATP-binding protein